LAIADFDYLFRDDFHPDFFCGFLFKCLKAPVVTASNTPVTGAAFAGEPSSGCMIVKKACAGS
jgi:hypothetical protein